MINQNLPIESSIPHVPGATARRDEPLDADYTSRVVNLRDGSDDGSMSVRWGKEGPKGRRSSGLN